MADSEAPKSYRDPYWSDLASSVEQRLGIPSGLLVSVLTKGERSNADQVSEKGAKTPFQVTPTTRELILKRDGIDAYLSPENAAEAAGLVLKDGLRWANGKTSDPAEQASLAAGFYHAGGDPANWGPRTKSYVNRVMVGMQPVKESTMAADFQKWMASNPATPAASDPAAQPPAPPPADKPLDQGFAAWMNQQRTGPSDIPVEPGANTTPTATPEPSLGDKIVGAGEAALSTATGLTGGAVGTAAGAIGGLAGAVLDGQYGTQAGAQRVEDAAAQGANALTYQPRTPAGQDITAAVGNAMQNVLPAAAVMPGIAGAGRPVAPAARGVLTEAQQAVKAKVEAAAARRAQAAANDPSAQPATGTFGAGSIGAAQVTPDVLRRQAAQELPVPIDLTKGQATRDFEQQRFEGEMAKDPVKGQALRDRAADQHAQVWKNFDAWLDDTGAQKTNLGEVGDTVKQALADRAQANKNEVNVAYAKADKSPEANAPVNPAQKVTIGEGDQTLTSSPIAFLNTKPGGLATTALADHARQYAIKLGIADLVDGQLVPMARRGGSTLMNAPAEPAVPIRLMEAWRKEINAATNQADPVQVRDATILKKLIDAQTEPVAGPLYRQARALRTRYAQNYENIGLVYDLMNDKPGMSDSKVAAEDVFRRSILSGKMEEVKQLRRILQTGGDNGQQAWKELQGATLRYIRDEAARNVSRNERGQEMVSVKGLDSAVTGLDKTGKLDFIFGKKGAEQLRALNDLSKVLFTAPPGAVNHSNTASVILAALDIATSGVAGMPLPIMSGLRILTTHVRDRQIQKRINEALGIKPQPKVKGPRSVIPPSSTAPANRAPESRTVH